MLHDQLTKNLKPGERLVRIIRRDPLAHLGAGLLAGVLLLGDFFLLAFLLQYRAIGLIAFLVVFFAGGVLIARIILEWKLNTLLVTSERIIHVSQRGLFLRTVTEAMHQNVTDVRFSVRGVLQTLIGLGSVEVQTAGEGENLKLEGVRHPQAVQALITSTLRTSKHRAIPLSAQELVQALGRMKEELGDDAFHRAIAAADESKRKDGDSHDG